MEQVRSVAGRPRCLRRAVLAGGVALVVLANTGAIVWLWEQSGNVTELRSTGDVLVSVARITGLLAAYSALLQVLLLARIPWLERLRGLDGLSVWHRWNGHACLWLTLAHTVFSVWGYALLDKFSIGHELSTMLAGGIYPGMITATVGTALVVAVVVASIVVVRKRLPYEAWYAVHLTAYAGIALAWFHQIPTGNELVLDVVAAGYWRGLYVATLALLVWFRILVPVAAALRFRMRVSEVVPEGSGAISLRIAGRGLERLQAEAGQFFLWRFLTRDRWWASHPFSLSEAPRGDTLRITVKALGDFSTRLATVAPGTRVLAEGPFGVFTDAVRRTGRALLIGGGIGITPIRALAEALEADLVVVYRALSEDDVIFRDELDQLARAQGFRLHYVIGDHTAPGGEQLLSAGHLRELVPDIAERDVYVCGPPGMTRAIERNVRSAGVPRKLVHVERFAL